MANGALGGDAARLQLVDGVGHVRALPAAHDHPRAVLAQLLRDRITDAKDIARTVRRSPESLDEDQLSQTYHLRLRLRSLSSLR